MVGASEQHYLIIEIWCDFQKSLLHYILIGQGGKFRTQPVASRENIKTFSVIQRFRFISGQFLKKNRRTEYQKNRKVRYIKLYNIAFYV